MSHIDHPNTSLNTSELGSICAGETVTSLGFDRDGQGGALDFGFDGWDGLLRDQSDDALWEIDQ